MPSFLGLSFIFVPNNCFYKFKYDFVRKGTSFKFKEPFRTVSEVYNTIKYLFTDLFNCVSNFKYVNNSFYRDLEIIGFLSAN